MRRVATQRLAIIAICIFTAACALRPAETRAKLDQQVGKTTAEGTSWEVRNGLAQFVDERPGELTLWAQAPAWSVEVRPGESATTSWRLRLNNVMPGGELTVVEGGGIVTQVDQPLPTRQVWDVEIADNDSTRIDFAPPDAETAEKW